MKTLSDSIELYRTLSNFTCFAHKTRVDCPVIKTAFCSFRRESVAIWKSDQRPAWTSAACAAETARRVPRTCTTGAKRAQAVRCLAAEVSVDNFTYARARNAVKITRSRGVILSTHTHTRPSSAARKVVTCCTDTSTVALAADS